MARPKNRGGYQAPRNGGGASAPGALSQRKVPHLERSGLPYGENKAVNEQQQAAPLSAGTPGAGVSPAPRRVVPNGAEGIFGGTDRPAEPMTAGVDWGAGPGAPTTPELPGDPTYRLRAIIAEYPHLADELMDLLDG